jgi:hypothetical protein
MSALARSLLKTYAALILLGSACTAVLAQAPRAEAPEASVKAAFLYKFAAYVEWPASAFTSPTAPLVFGVTGNDDVAAELVRVTAGRQISGHPISVRRVTGDMTGLHVLFVGRNSGDRLGAILRAAQVPPLLVVTESERGLELGAAINFLMNDDRVAFEVAPDAAEKNGLRISSRMLAVAKRVVQR